MALNDRTRLAPFIKSTDQRRVLIRLVREHGWRRGAEIGVLRGKTLFSLLDECPDLVMIGVDQWKQLPLRDCDCAETYTQFDMAFLRRDVMARAGHYGWRCRILAGDSVAMADQVEDASLDFVFIDGDHTSDGIRRDLAAWRGKVRAGGMILGHDVSWPTVRAAIDAECPGWASFGEEVWGVAQP